MAPQEFFKCCSAEELQQIYCVLNAFNIHVGHITDVHYNTSGRLNKTIIVTYLDENGFKKLVLQIVNHKVFTNPVGLMHNVGLVTSHMAQKGVPTQHFYQTKTKTSDSTYLYYDQVTGSYWRVYDYIEAEVKNAVTSPKDMYSLGVAIGNFSKDLSDFDASSLVETIPDFHHTRNRFLKYEKIKWNPEARIVLDNNKEVFIERECDITECAEDILFIKDRADQYGIIVDALEDHSIPVRVSHNDTKLNNVLLDPVTGEVICLIDPDTIMRGTLLYDYGDAARYGCNVASEEETELEKVQFDLPRFEALTCGLLKSMRGVITKEEIALLPRSAWMMTAELVIRFHGDHLEGNPYFGASYDRKNLERARVQKALLIDIERKFGQMEEIVSRVWKEVNC